jgi:hypothetical protein
MGRFDAHSSERIDLLVDMQYFDPAVTGETSVHKEGLVVFFTRLAMASVCVAGLGVGLAGPANAADPNALGTYTFEGEDGESATWTVTPCDDDTDHCVRVAEAGDSKRAPWSANAYWNVGSWILFVDQPDAILCKNGTSVPGRNNYSWDATSLSGFASTFSNGACNSAPQSVDIPFKLTRVAGSGPFQYPPEPVDAQPNVPPLSAEAAFTPAEPMPVESDPNLVAEPPVVPSGSDQLTEAEVAEPGFNGGGHR